MLGSPPAQPPPPEAALPPAARVAPRQVALRARVVMKAGKPQIIISGPPASGKGTQCETIVSDLGLVHISAGDLLRAEVAAGTENGKTAKEFMDKGQLVPDAVVTGMVKDRLTQDDCGKAGWLLDGYPRSASQAQSLEDAGISPKLVLVLEVPDEVLIERVVGRRSDPETGKIYHLTFNPPPADVLERCVQRSDDTEEKAKSRLEVFYKNQDCLNAYEGMIVRIDGNRARDDVYADIKAAITSAFN